MPDCAVMTTLARPPGTMKSSQPIPERTQSARTQGSAGGTRQESSTVKARRSWYSASTFVVSHMPTTASCSGSS